METRRCACDTCRQSRVEAKTKSLEKMKKRKTRTYSFSSGKSGSRSDDSSEDGSPRRPLDKPNRFYTRETVVREFSDFDRPTGWKSGGGAIKIKDQDGTVQLMTTITSTETLFQFARPSRNARWAFNIEYRRGDDFSEKSARVVDLGEHGGGIVTLAVEMKIMSNVKDADKLTGPPTESVSDGTGKLLEGWRASIEAKAYWGDVYGLLL